MGGAEKYDAKTSFPYCHLLMPLCKILKGKISSKREWVFNIYNQAKEKNIPVFMKEDLLGILNEDEFVQEFPKEFGGIK